MNKITIFTKERDQIFQNLLEEVYVGSEKTLREISSYLVSTFNGRITNLYSLFKHLKVYGIIFPIEIHGNNRRELKIVDSTGSSCNLYLTYDYITLESVLGNQTLSFRYSTKDFSLSTINISTLEHSFLVYCEYSSIAMGSSDGDFIYIENLPKYGLEFYLSLCDTLDTYKCLPAIDDNIIRKICIDVLSKNIDQIHVTNY